MSTHECFLSIWHFILQGLLLRFFSMQEKQSFFQSTFLTLYQHELGFGTWLIKANHYPWQSSLTGESCLSCHLVDFGWLSQCHFPFLMFLFYILGENVNISNSVSHHLTVKQGKSHKLPPVSPGGPFIDLAWYSAWCFFL